MVDIKKFVSNFELSQNVLDHLRETEASLQEYVSMLMKHSPSSIDWFLYDYLVKEAVASSQIENVIYSPDMLKLYEENILKNGITPDLIKIINKISRSNETLMNEDEFADFAIRKNLDKTYEDYVQGMTSNGPGIYRKYNVWIGLPSEKKEDAIYTPPDYREVADYIEQFVEYFNGNNTTNPFVKCAITHVLFSKIHPFRDGNGRTARALMNHCLKTMIQKNVGVKFTYPPVNISTSLKMAKLTYFKRQNDIIFDNDVDNNDSFNRWIDYILTMYDEQIYFLISQLKKYNDVLCNMDKSRVI